MEHLTLNLDLQQAQRLRSLVHLAANLAGKLSKPLTEADLKALAVELARDGAGDRKQFADLMPQLNKFITEQGKVESQNRKVENEKRRAEAQAKKLDNARTRVEKAEATLRNAKDDAKAKAQKALNEAREALTKLQKEVSENTVKTAQTKQPNGMGEKSGN